MRPSLRCPNVQASAFWAELQLSAKVGLGATFSLSPSCAYGQQTREPDKDFSFPLSSWLHCCQSPSLLWSKCQTRKEITIKFKLQLLLPKNDDFGLESIQPTLTGIIFCGHKPTSSSPASDQETKGADFVFNAAKAKL